MNWTGRARTIQTSDSHAQGSIAMIPYSTVDIVNVMNSSSAGTNESDRVARVVRAGRHAAGAIAAAVPWLMAIMLWVF